jgi:hypothetical protein
MSRPKILLFEDSETDAYLLQLKFPWIDFVRLTSEKLDTSITYDAAVFDWYCPPSWESSKKEAIQFCNDHKISWCFFSGTMDLIEHEHGGTLTSFNKIGERKEFESWLTSKCPKPEYLKKSILSASMFILGALK